MEYKSDRTFCRLLERKNWEIVVWALSETPKGLRTLGSRIGGVGGVGGVTRRQAHHSDIWKYFVVSRLTFVVLFLDLFEMVCFYAVSKAFRLPPQWLSPCVPRNPLCFSCCLIQLQFFLLPKKLLPSLSFQKMWTLFSLYLKIRLNK